MPPRPSAQAAWVGDYCIATGWQLADVVFTKRARGARTRGGKHSRVRMSLPYGEGRGEQPHESKLGKPRGAIVRSAPI
jgi:hypothetical protein